MHDSDKERRVTTRQLLEMKQRGEKIVVLTAYDYLFARLVDEAGGATEWRSQALRGYPR